MGPQFQADRFEDLQPLFHLEGRDSPVEDFSAIAERLAGDPLPASLPIEVELSSLEAVGDGFLCFLDPGGGVGCFGRAGVVVDEQLVAEFAAEQYVSRDVEDFPGEVPEG